MDKNNCLELMNSLQNLVHLGLEDAVEEIMRKEVLEHKKLERYTLRVANNLFNNLWVSRERGSGSIRNSRNER